VWNHPEPNPQWHFSDALSQAFPSMPKWIWNDELEMTSNTINKSNNWNNLNKNPPSPQLAEMNVQTRYPIEIGGQPSLGWHRRDGVLF
jgi:hypothetical protein